RRRTVGRGGVSARHGAPFDAERGLARRRDATRFRVRADAARRMSGDAARGGWLRSDAGWHRALWTHGIITVCLVRLCLSSGGRDAGGTDAARRKRRRRDAA